MCWQQWQGMRQAVKPDRPWTMVGVDPGSVRQMMIAFEASRDFSSRCLRCLSHGLHSPAGLLRVTADLRPFKLSCDKFAVCTLGCCTLQLVEVGSKRVNSAHRSCSS